MASRVFVSVLVVALVGITAVDARETGSVPIIYSTDLHHPHMDPDDHFDLATLFAIPEFDVRAIVLDSGSHQLKAPGRIPVEQMLRLTGRKIPFAIGLGDPLSAPEDAGLDQAERFQQAVRLILDTLRRSTEQVCVFTTGSVRDVAAAMNREPELLREKIKRLYINIGNPADGDQSRTVACFAATLRTTTMS